MDLIHVNVASPAGAYTSGNASFFRYIVRLAELEPSLSKGDSEALGVLSAIPHAFEADEEITALSGHGWRIVPAQGDMDWPVLEATPQRLRTALQRARHILWNNAARLHVSAREIDSIEHEIDAVMGVIMRAEAAGFAVNVSYVA